MANGLRKLIKNARKNEITRRTSRFGTRLRVEELEERIAPAVLGAGEYIPYDTATGVGVLYNAGAFAVDVTVTDGGAANALDTFVINCGTAGAVSLQASDDLSGTGGILITDGATVQLTLATGVNPGDAGAGLWAEGVAHLNGADPGNANVAASGGDVTGSITLDNANSVLTALTVTDGGTGTGSFTGALTVADDVGAVTMDGTATGAWQIGGDVTGNVAVGATAATTTITIGGDLGVGGGDTFDTTTGGIAGAINVTGDITSAITSTTTISGAITATGSITGAIVGGSGISGAITADDIQTSITATTGDISGLIRTTGAATDGAISGAIQATAGAITGGITTSDGDAGTNLAHVAAVVAGTNVSGTAFNIDGNLGDLDVTGNVSTDINAAGAVNDLDIGGTLSAVITAGTGFNSGDNAETITGGITATGSLIATTGGFAAGDTLTIGGVGVAGAITATAGGIGSNIAVSAGGVSGAITATAGGISGAIDITAGGMSGNIIATAGGISGPVTVTAGGLSGTVRATTGDISGAITVTDDGMSGSIEALTGAITGAIVIGDADADDDGTLSGTITAPDATAGDIGAVTIDDGITATGAILAGHDITGAIAINEGGIAAGGTSTTGIVRAGNDILGGVTIADGGLSGTVRAVAGDVTAVVVLDGGVTATGLITAGNDVGAVTVADDGLAGTIIADNDITGAIAITDGIAATGVVQAGNDLSGAVTVATGDIAAGATVAAGNDITGNITVADGVIAANITAQNEISGSIVSTNGAISGTITALLGDLSGNVTAGVGNIASIVVGGDIDGSAISAEDDITSIAVTGAILAGTTITASDADVDGTGNIGTIIAGDGINATIAAVNIDTIRSGGLAGEDIEGTITASGDIDLVDAGNGIIEATVTAGVAVPGSPLATFISDGYSYAVWAISGTPTSPTEPTAAVGVSAELVFDGNGGNPTLEINNLEGTSAGTSIYITSRADTGVEQLFWDPDVDVYDAPITLTALNAASAITIGTLYVEGSFTDIGGDSDITINNVVVEGGVGGTISVAAGEDIEFGWVEASLTINVAGGGKAGDLILKSNSDVANSATAYAINGGAIVSVNGSLSNVYLGDASAGFVGDLGDSGDVATLTATGSIDDIFIAGDVLGNIRATSIGDIEVDGNVGNCDDGDADTLVDDGVAASIDITASTGSIGDIKVAGVIGGDTDGSTVTIQATTPTGNIGAINAIGNIGTIAVAGNTVANSVTIAAGGSITKVESTANIGDFDTDGGGADVSTLVIITATNGTIGSVTAGGSIGINANITAGGNIGAVSAPDTTQNEGLIGGTIKSLEGNIGSVNTVEGTISATIEATNGDIDQVAVLDSADDAGFEVDTGNVTGNITAGGDIDLVVGADISGIITAGAATTASPVTQFIYGNYNGSTNSVLFELNAAAGATYGYTFDADNQIIDITIDNWDAGAALAAGAIDLALTTAVINDPEGDNGEPYAAAFNLNSLNFTPDSVANNADVLGTVTVEGSINIIDTGTLTALIAEGNVQGPIVVTDSATSPLTAFSAGSVTGVGSPTLAEMQGVFEDLGGGAITFGAPADGTVFTLPVSSSQDISFAFGTATGLAGVNGNPLVLNATSVESFLVTVSGGAITDITGTVNDSGSVFIDGDLTWAITAENLSSVIITGNVSALGSIYANNIGNVTIGRTIQDYIDENGAFADTAAAQAWLDANGNFAGAITSDDVLDSGLDGAIGNITIYGDYTGDIVADGNAGNVEVGQGYYGVDGGLLAMTGDMTGTLTVGGNMGSFDAYGNIVGAADSFIAVSGDMADGVWSQYGNIGGSGVIMIGGDTDYIWSSYGVVSADVFIGGDGDTYLDFGGTAITGNLVLGAVDGVDGVSFYLYENNDEEDNEIEFDIWDDYADGAMLMEFVAGAVTTTGVTVDRITMFEYYEFYLETYTNTNAEVDIDEVFIIDTDEAGYVDLYVDMDGGNLGTVVVSQTNALSTTSMGEQAAFLATYNAANGTSLACDIISSTPILDNQPSDLDGALKTDEDNLDLNLYLYGLDNLTGGVIAEGDLYVDLGQDVGVNTFGYMLSLHEGVEAYVYANDTIGSIAASSDIYADLETEGVVAVDDGSAMQDAVDLYGLAGLPAWFAGGVLSEIGDIEMYVTADGDQTLVAGMVPVSAGYAMGAVYAMLGEVSGTFNLSASFGGVVAPLDSDFDFTVNVPLSSQIDMFVAPYSWGGAIGGNHPDAQLELLWGEVLVTASNPYANGFEKVTAVGSGMLAFVDTYDDELDVIVITGLADPAAQLNIAGDVDDLVINGDWAGQVTVSGNADGAIGEIDFLTVNGDIDATTADLNAFNFASHIHNGVVTGTSPVDAYQFATGTLNKANKSISWTNQAGDAQTLYANASKAMQIQYSTFFGQLTGVVVTGQGTANIVSVNGAYDADNSRTDLKALKSIAKQATKAGLDMYGSGTAHLGSLSTNKAWGKATLKNVVIDGFNESLLVDGKVSGLLITGDADWVDVSRSINNAFIGVNDGVEYIQTDKMSNVSIFGSVDEFDAINAKKVYIYGGAEKMSGQNWTKVAVDGTVEELWMFAGTRYGKLDTCRFGWVNHENIDNRKWLQTSETVGGGEGGDANGGDDSNNNAGDGGAGAVGPMLKNINPYYNPVKVIRTIAPGLYPYFSAEYPG